MYKVFNVDRKILTESNLATSRWGGCFGYEFVIIGNKNIRSIEYFGDPITAQITHYTYESIIFSINNFFEEINEEKLQEEVDNKGYHLMAVFDTVEAAVNFIKNLKSHHKKCENCS